MRFRSIAVVTLLSLCAPGSARAQSAAADPQCTSQNITLRDACQQTIDLFQYMAPQLGLAITGGNATLAQGGTLGGLPHWTVGVRVNLLAGHVPELQTPDPTGINQRSAYPVVNQFLGLPAVDASIGLFKGLPLALSNVGGVDLLLSAAYVPTIESDDIKIVPETNLKIGYGVRVGLLQESLVVPGVSFSYLMRGLPKTDITGTVGTATFNVSDLDLKSSAWRITASKSLILFTLAAGAGQDMYDISTGVSSTVGAASTNTFTVKQKATRTNYFADLSMNLLLLKLVGEVGMTSGGAKDIMTHNTFTTAASTSRMYGSVGARIGF
ncbi:MAG: hypothetical protein WD825_17085 [Gemmatimonadaceae bacterium]